MRLALSLWGLLLFALTPTAVAGKERGDAPHFEIIAVPEAGDSAESLSLIRLSHVGYPTIELGYANIAQGTRLPAEGLVRVPGDDLGIILDGVQTATIVDHKLKIVGRRIAHVFPNTPQAAYYDTDQRLIFIWFGEFFSEDQIKREPLYRYSEKDLAIWRRRDLNAAYALLPLFRDKSFATASLNVVYECVMAGQEASATANAPQPNHDFRLILSGEAEAVVNGKTTHLAIGDIIHLRRNDDWSMQALERLEMLSMRYEEEGAK